MLNLTAAGGRLCEGLRRRDILRIGSLGALGAGIGLPELMASGGTTGRARSCIVVFLNGLGHMGIVADENGFYHASSSKGITYSKFEGYWANRIVGFRKLNLNSNPADLER